MVNWIKRIINKIKEKKDIYGIYSQLEATRWQRLNSIAFIILTIVTIFIAIYFNVFPQPYKPDIHLSTNYQKNVINFTKEYSTVDFLLYIYNQGSGACVDARLEYPNFLIPSIRPQKIFRQYTDIKNELSENYTGGAFISFDNTWRMGILDKNEALVVDLTRRHDKLQLPHSFNLNVTCNNGEKETIIITNGNYFIVENPIE